MLIYWNCSGFSAWMASLWSFTTNLLFLATCSWLGHSRKLQEIPINVLKFMLVVTKYHYEQTHGKLKRETSLLRSTQLIFRNALVQNCVTRALGVFVVVADEILSDMLIFWNCIGFSSWMASLWSFRIGRSRNSDLEGSRTQHQLRRTCDLRWQRCRFGRFRNQWFGW